MHPVDTVFWDNGFDQANFAVFFPKALPGMLRIQKMLFRPVDPQRDYPRCSLKTLLGDDQRLLSIKQFNYDWGPPAYDCPSLWKNHIKFPELDIPEPTPHLIGESVLWIGFNYRNKHAASITRDRTQIELVVHQGTFEDVELIQIASALTPLNPEQAARILSQSYATLSYGYPDLVPAINVPISFWKVSDGRLRFQKAHNIQEISIKQRPQLGPYRLNSLFTYQKGKTPQEQSDRYEFIYEHGDIPGATIRLLKAHENSQTLLFPPTPDTTQKFRREQLDEPLYYAYRSKRYGPHEVAWRDQNYNYLLLTKPASWTDRKWFLRFFSSNFGGN